MIYINKIGNRITFKVQTGNYLELLPPETELLGSTKSKMFKDEERESLPYLEINEVY